jgi:SAM-dependent methyltransferase
MSAFRRRLARVSLAVLAAFGVAIAAPPPAPTQIGEHAADSLHLSPDARAGAPVARPHDDGARSRHRFEDPEVWGRIWDDPERNGWQEPQRVVDLLRLRPGMTVADIGAGTGYFNPYLSRGVGPEGVVYAVDIESTLVDAMRERAVKEKTPNVVPILAAPDDPRIPVARLDRVLLVDTYHHIDGRIGYFVRLRRLLDDGSLVAIVDWLPGVLARGPGPEHKVRPQEVMDEMRSAGYQVVEQVDLEYQFVLLFRPRR